MAGMLLAPRINGMLHRVTFAPLWESPRSQVLRRLVLDGPINGAKFAAYVEQILVPALSPGAIVMRNNPGSDKVAGVREAIAAAGAAPCFLPAYSPDLDPIEQVFAKLKNALCKMARRTVDALWDSIGNAFDDFPPIECCNYFRNAGYGST
jgi:transposase